MTRIEAIAAWFFTCLGITLLAVSIAVVPANAFADGGDDCASACTSECGSDEECYNACVAQCCAAVCEEEETCQQTCCEIACDFDETCVGECMSAKAFCPGGTKCEIGVACITQSVPCDQKNTYCNKTVGCAPCICRQNKGAQACDCRDK